MYGYFNNIIRTLIVERFGQQRWEIVVKKCKGYKKYNDSSTYDEQMTMKLIETAANVLQESVNDLLETVGEFYLHQLRVHGYDLLFKTLGENLLQFLDNLDYVHAVMKEKYPEMIAPSFRCDKTSTDSNIVLHYYSVRKGLYRMVIGLVRAIGGIYFQCDLDIQVKNVSVEQFGGKFTREHVIFAISLQTDSEEGLVPPTFVAQTRRHSERQIIKEDVEKVRAKLEHIRREFGEGFLPLNQDKVQQAKWKAIINVRNLYKGFNASYPSRFHMNVFIFCQIFPFHLVFDEKMRIVQSGIQLQKLLPVISTDTATVTQCFTLVHPVMMDLNFNNIQKLMTSPFIVQAKLEAMHTQYGDNKPLLRLRGQMINIDMLGSILFLCSPYVTQLKDLEDRAMHLADIPVHDVTRNMLLTTVAANHVVKAEMSPKEPEERRPPQNSKQVVVVRERANFLKGLDYSDPDNLRNALFEALAELERQRSINDEMIQRLVPKPWVKQVRAGESPIAGDFKAVSVLFCDLVMFSQIVAKCSPKETVEMLNTLQEKFDRLLVIHGVDRVQSIGDAFVVTSGVPEPCPSHLERIANTALAMLVAAKEVRCPFNYGSRQGRYCKIRIGVHTGPVKAGIVGTRIPNLFIMGDTVTMASRLESHGVPDHIHISPEVYKQLRSKQYTLEKRGDVEIRGRGKMSTYLLLRNESVSVDELMGRAPRGDEAIVVKVTSDDTSRTSSGGSGSGRSNRVHPTTENGNGRVHGSQTARPSHGLPFPY